MRMMKCAECETLGKRSRVVVGGSRTTLLGYSPYYDEEGLYHNHDPNTITTEYCCSEGHVWERRSKRQCPSCSYPEVGYVPAT